ncbi:spermidine synthase [Haematomicrobium sanguinis]|uniref:spermidine synthase n=1 Tax=Haematomicrobium sanguinis TaxID=479106 RepID=UPI00146FA858|nr:fused MFS/spermidine synthase [Haematomicrobium sanguinis]
MAKKSAVKASGGSKLEPGIYPIDTGIAELVRDEYNSNAWLLKINGVMSSHIDLDEPENLDFEYMRWMSAVIEDRFDDAEGLRVTHLGGGACTMARYLLHHYPNSAHVVAEIDGKLAESVRTWFDLPRAPRLKIRVADARATLDALADSSADVIIRDVFAGSTTPTSLISATAAEQAKRVLKAGGIYVVNSGDSPQLAHAKREAATLLEVFGNVLAVADPAMFKGRRHGNVVFVASAEPVAVTAELTRRLLGGGVPANTLTGQKLAAWVSGAPGYPRD